MPQYYSLDLRERVLKYLESNNNKKATSQLFRIGIATVYRWIALKRKKGHVRPVRREYAYKKIDDQKLIEYTRANPDRFLSEIALDFGLTPSGIFYALKRLKITRKKRQLSIERGTKKKGKIF